MKQFRGRFTTIGTKHIAPASCSIREIIIAPDAVGTALTLKIQDLDSPAFEIVPTYTMAVITTGIPVIIKFDNPVSMKGGVDAVFGGTFAGSVSIWITAEQGSFIPT